MSQCVGSAKASIAGEQAFEPLHATRPALFVAVTRFLIGEALVLQSELGLILSRAAPSSPATRAQASFPGPRVDELTMWLDFTVYAAHVVLFAVRRLHDDVIAPADADVDLRERDP